MAQEYPISSHQSNLVEIEERDQSNKLVATYVTTRKNESDKSGRVDVIIPKTSNSYARSALNVFLPAGYPHSVTKDYTAYQIYDSLQAFSSSIAGLLSSRAVLEGIGVGDSDASATSALILTVLQDSMGRIATILFAHRLGTALEPECKMYRLAADIFNDAAMILDCLSPALPRTSRVFLLSLSSILRALCGVAAGSSKASLSAHFATQGNLGELNAKDSSQETVISLMGMLVGTFVVSHIHSQSATWSAMIALLAIHLGTNYMAVRAVSMHTLNRQRANIVFSNMFGQISTVDDKAQKNMFSRMRILTPEQVSAQERIFERDAVLRGARDEILGYCRFGVQLREILDLIAKRNRTTGSFTGAESLRFAKLVEIFKDEGHITWYDAPHKTFLIVLKEPTCTKDQLVAWMHALYFAMQEKQSDDGGELLIEALEHTRKEVTSLVASGLWDALRNAGWDLETGALETKSGTRICLATEKN